MRRQSPLEKHFYMEQQQQDTGKDLFALLFLVMLMLAQVFMIMANDAVMDKSDPMVDQKGKGADKSFTPPKKPVVGKIIQKGDKILLVFEGKVYDPRKDGSKLINRGYTATSKDESGRETLILYVNYDGIIDSKLLSRGLAPLRGIGIIPLLSE